MNAFGLRLNPSKVIPSLFRAYGSSLAPSRVEHALDPIYQSIERLKLVAHRGVRGAR